MVDEDRSLILSWLEAPSGVSHLASEILFPLFKESLINS
jgi:hypothetical protein